MHITYMYLVIIKNKGNTPGLALGRRGVSWVSQWRLYDLLLHENLLLVLIDDVLELMITGGHDLRQLILYMYAMMMQPLAFRQQQLLK